MTNPRALLDFAEAMKAVQKQPRPDQAIGTEDMFDVAQLGLKIALNAADIAQTQDPDIDLRDWVAGGLLKDLGRRGLLHEALKAHLLREGLKHNWGALDHAADVFVSEVWPIFDGVMPTGRIRQVALSAYGWAFRERV